MGFFAMTQIFFFAKNKKNIGNQCIIVGGSNFYLGHYMRIWK